MSIEPARRLIRPTTQKELNFEANFYRIHCMNIVFDQWIRGSALMRSSGVVCYVFGVSVWVWMLFDSIASHVREDFGMTLNKMSLFFLRNKRNGKYLKKCDNGKFKNIISISLLWRVAHSG